MLAYQTYDDHLSVHDESNAAALGLTGAPIEGPNPLFAVRSHRHESVW